MALENPPFMADFFRRFSVAMFDSRVVPADSQHDINPSTAMAMRTSFGFQCYQRSSRHSQCHQHMRIAGPNVSQDLHLWGRRQEEVWYQKSRHAADYTIAITTCTCFMLSHVFGYCILSFFTKGVPSFSRIYNSHERQNKPSRR